MEGRSRSLVSREVTRLPISGSDPTYSPTGHILYVGTDGTTLRAVGFDATRLEVTSPSPVPVLENVHSGGFGDTGNFGLADNGSLVYLSGGFTNALRTLALARLSHQSGNQVILGSRNWIQEGKGADGVGVSDLWESKRVSCRMIGLRIA